MRPALLVRQSLPGYALLAGWLALTPGQAEAGPLAHLPFPNSELSAIAPLGAEAMRSIDAKATEGWWAAADEAKNPPTWLVIITHGPSGWRIFPVTVNLKSAGDGDKTPKLDDAEAAFREGDAVYFVGSHFGKKVGPMESKRAWMGRILESQIQRTGDDSLAVEMVVASNRFAVNQAINEALESIEDTVPLTPVTAAETKAYGPDHEDLKPAEKKRLSAGAARPINIEGAALIDGNLWLGLRFPVTADGEPILVRLKDWREQFEAGGPDAVKFAIDAVAVVPGVGTRKVQRGVRDLAYSGQARTLLMLAGSLDSPTDKYDSPVLLEDRLGAKEATTELFAVTLPEIPTTSTKTASSKSVPVIRPEAHPYPTLPTGPDINPEAVAIHPTSGSIRILSDRSKGVVRLDGAE